jgi:predicted lipoprotein with Yx(FWY)xxD motif
VTVPAGLNATDFGSFSNGGIMQTTYMGWPLYTYSGDKMPDEDTGNSGTWPVLAIPFTAP